MNAKRLNLCPAIRAALSDAGYSTVRVVNAVNSALGELSVSSSESKLGDGRITKTAYKVTETTAAKYEGNAASVPLRFDAWNGAIAKAEKIASFDSVAIPVIFKAWLDKMKATPEEIAKEQATIVKEA